MKDAQVNTKSDRRQTTAVPCKGKIIPIEFSLLWDDLVNICNSPDLNEPQSVNFIIKTFKTHFVFFPLYISYTFPLIKVFLIPIQTAN